MISSRLLFCVVFACLLSGCESDPETIAQPEPAPALTPAEEARAEELRRTDAEIEQLAREEARAYSAEQKAADVERCRRALEAMLELEKTDAK